MTPSSSANHVVEGSVLSVVFVCLSLVTVISRQRQLAVSMKLTGNIH